MKSKAIGENTSPEATIISGTGLWILWQDTEYFLDYEQFPWFRDARISEITHVVAESSTHLHWPDLDVDLCLDIIKAPDRFPLVSKG